MDDNKSYLSGFDSVEPNPKKAEGTFNPTPMFSGMKPQNGYTVTPEGSFFTASNEENTPTEKTEAEVATSAAEPKTEPSIIDSPAVTPVVTPAEAASPAEEVPAVAEQPKPEASAAEKAEASYSASTPAESKQPAKNNPPIFMPSGTYSYSDDSKQSNDTPAVPSTTPPAATSANSENSYTPPVFTPDAFSSSSGQNTSPSQPSQNGSSTPLKEKKPKKYGAGVIIISALLAAIIGAGGGVFGVFFAQKNLDTANTSSVTSKEESQNTAPQSVTNITVDETVNSSIEAVAKKAGPSIIGIRTTAAVTNFFGGSSEATGEGSGIIYTTDGYIITNYHVIESAVESSKSKVEVFLADDTENALEATVVGYNIASDLAVVKVEKSGLSAIEFADSNKLSVGQYAIAIGNPGGLEFIGSVSSGVISGLNRSVTVGTGSTMSLIQTDAAINPGNSGGALVDITGKLIGVNSVKLVSTGYEGMGFAIPSNTVKEICDNIIAKQNEPTPYIGIQISQSYTAEQLIALGYPAGAVVVSVVEGGPAYESQIQRGDIITEFNGVTINNYTELENAISQCKPGNSVTVKIFRAGRFYSSHINVAANNAQ